jgi:shikimate kinase
MTPIRNPQSAIRNVILIGYRGTGKSTVGRLLAARLGWPFVDADEEIERRASKSIAAIFADQGESHFRDLEEQVVADLLARQQHVISLGGGAVLRQESRQAIGTGGMIVWLQASPELILKRIEADATTSVRRPNLTSHGGLPEIKTLLAIREPLYRQCATLEVDTDARSTPAIVEDILRHMPAHLRQAGDG